MKTNNRPKIKLVEWEVRTKSDFLLWNSPDDTAIWDGERTGNTREVERPMYDTEYIDYLEKENKELKEQVELKNSVMSVVNGIEQRLSANQQDQFLKVVESVLDKVAIGELLDNTTKTELLQEIKSAMKKEGE